METWELQRVLLRGFIIEMEARKAEAHRSPGLCSAGSFEPLGRGCCGGTVLAEAPHGALHTKSGGLVAAASR